MWTATPWTDSSLLEPISLPIVYYVDGLILNSIRTRPLQHNNHSKVRLVTTIRRSHHLPNRITSFASTDELCLPQQRFPFAGGSADGIKFWNLWINTFIASISAPLTCVPASNIGSSCIVSSTSSIYIIPTRKVRMVY